MLLERILHQMTDLIIGNICSLLAMVTDSISSTRKTTKGVLMMQSISQVIYFLGAIVLKGYSAAVQNAVSLFRNLVAIREKQRKWLELALIAVAVVLGLVFNNRGFWGLLPVVANLEYSIAVFRFRDNERALKIAFLFCAVCFTIFNGVIFNFVGMIANFIILATTILNLCKKR